MKKLDPLIESWNKQLKILLKEGMTITTSTGQNGIGDSISISATDEDAVKLSKLLQNAGISGSIRSSSQSSDSMDSDGVSIDVEPLAQDEIMSKLSHNDSGDNDLDFLKRMIVSRNEANHDHDSNESDASEDSREICSKCECDPCECDDEHDDDDEQEDGHEDHDHTEEVCSDCECDPCECDDDDDEAIMVGEEQGVTEDEDVEEGNEFTGSREKAIRAGQDTFKVGGKTYHVKGDTSDEKRQVEEGQAVRDDRISARKGRRLFYWLVGWQDAAQRQGLKVKRVSGLDTPDWTHYATDKEGNVRGKFCVTKVAQNSHGFIDQQAKDKNVKEGEDDLLRPEHDELARRENLKHRPDDEVFDMYGGMYRDEFKDYHKNRGRMRHMHDIAGPKGRLPEDEEMCAECGGSMYEGHSCGSEKLDEWANSPVGKSKDEDFKTELDYMTKLISGGLNGMKRDQTTLPHTRVKSELSETDDVKSIMKRLSGIR